MLFSELFEITDKCLWAEKKSMEVMYEGEWIAGLGTKQSCLNGTGIKC